MSADFWRPLDREEAVLAGVEPFDRVEIVSYRRRAEIVLKESDQIR